MKKNLAVLSGNGGVFNKFSALVDINDELQSLVEQEQTVLTSSLDENVQDALRNYIAAQKRTPKKNVEWSDGNRGNSTCKLLSSRNGYLECKKIGFLECVYYNNEPNFDEATTPGSVVDISDLYDCYSVSELKKRGSGRINGSSFHDMAQDKMRSSGEIIMQMKVWRDGTCSETEFSNDRKTFYKWRDANDLVPHEDANCKTIRLVKRAVHKVFTHKGGIVNAINIKKHFKCK